MPAKTKEAEADHNRMYMWSIKTKKMIIGSVLPAARCVETCPLWSHSSSSYSSIDTLTSCKNQNMHQY
jgi:hypothetical protein